MDAILKAVRGVPGDVLWVIGAINRWVEKYNAWCNAKYPDSNDDGKDDLADRW
jgi:hypothetical protein